MEMKKFARELCRVFADKTGCSIQHNGCPCNTDFHALDDSIDFRHICWLMLLAIRGDYVKDREDLLNEIREELNEGE